MTDAFSHDYVFRPPALETLAALSADERDEVHRLIEQICRDPSPDNRQIFDFTIPPVELRLADDGLWTISFNVVPPFVVRILAIMPSPLRGIEP